MGHLAITSDGLQTWATLIGMVVVLVWQRIDAARATRQRDKTNEAVAIQSAKVDAVKSEVAAVKTIVNGNQTPALRAVVHLSQVIADKMPTPANIGAAADAKSNLDDHIQTILASEAKKPEEPPCP
jgi:hypothetical protein